VFVTILASLAMLETGLRVTHRYPMGNTEGYFAQGGISYLLKKNVTKEVFWPSMSFTVHTSDLGFRSPKPGHPDIGDRPYYAALGASDVFGNGLNYEDTFVGIFHDKILDHGYGAVNLGIAGHHLLEQEALFTNFVHSMERPPDVVLVFFNPLFIGGFDDIHTNVTVRRGDLFPNNAWKVALLRKILSNTSMAYCFWRDGVRRTQQKILPNRESALSFYIERFGSDHPIHLPGRRREFLDHLKRFGAFIKRTGATPIYIYCPPAGTFLVNDLTSKGQLKKGLIDTQFFVDIVREHCSEENIRFVDLTPVVQKRFDSGEKLNFEADGHFNKATSRLVGEFLYDVLKPGNAPRK
jgi:hypothetical protein